MRALRFMHSRGATTASTRSKRKSKGATKDDASGRAAGVRRGGRLAARNSPSSCDSMHRTHMRSVSSALSCRVCARTVVSRASIGAGGGGGGVRSPRRRRLDGRIGRVAISCRRRAAAAGVVSAHGCTCAHGHGGARADAGQHGERRPGDGGLAAEESGGSAAVACQCVSKASVAPPPPHLLPLPSPSPPVPSFVLDRLLCSHRLD